MRWAIAVLILGHGLIHLMGAAKGLGLADLDQLEQPISKGAGLLWLAVGVVLIVAAIAVVASVEPWWPIGLVGVVLSQGLIVSAWSDAMAGTVVNVLLLAVVAYGFAATGPMSLRARYSWAVQERLARTAPSVPPSRGALAHLPEPVQRYVRRSGAVGQPRVTHFRAMWKGRIRALPDDPWMEFVAEQHNFVDPPARFFFMNARRGGLPIDVLHVFRDAAATMDVRLLSLVPVADGAGPELTRAETVTLLNDLSILAPGALVDPEIQWEAVGDREARARYTVGVDTVSALLSFNEADELVDFISDDRLVASPDASGFTRQRWSTPLSNYRRFGPWRAAGRGEGWWHPDGSRPYAYIELELTELEVNPTPGRARRGRTGPR